MEHVVIGKNILDLSILIRLEEKKRKNGYGENATKIALNVKKEEMILIINASSVKKIYTFSATKL